MTKRALWHKCIRLSKRKCRYYTVTIRSLKTLTCGGERKKKTLYFPISIMEAAGTEIFRKTVAGSPGEKKTTRKTLPAGFLIKLHTSVSEGIDPVLRAKGHTEYCPDLVSPLVLSRTVWLTELQQLRRDISLSEFASALVVCTTWRRFPENRATLSARDLILWRAPLQQNHLAFKYLLSFWIKILICLPQRVVEKQIYYTPWRDDS